MLVPCMLLTVQSSPVRYALKHKVLTSYMPAERDRFLGHIETVLGSHPGLTHSHGGVITEPQH